MVVGTPTCEKLAWGMTTKTQGFGLIFKKRHEYMKNFWSYGFALYASLDLVASDTPPAAVEAMHRCNIDSHEDL